MLAYGKEVGVSTLEGWRLLVAWNCVEHTPLAFPQTVCHT
jgi:hypothetical protein